MTNYERIKNMSVEEMAGAIAEGISSDCCDYCVSYNSDSHNGDCYGVYCSNKSEKEVIAGWLESKVKE